MLKLKCISINKTLQPQTGKLVWICTLQAVADGTVQGGQLQVQYAAAPPFDVLDVLQLDKVPPAA